MFTCKFCGRQMNVSALEYESNNYCNTCFDQRVSYLHFLQGWDAAIAAVLNLTDQKECYPGYYTSIVDERDINKLEPTTPTEWLKGKYMGCPGCMGPCGYCDNLD